MSRAGLVVGVLLATRASLGAWVPTLNPQSLADAIAIGQSRFDDTRSRLHATYHVPVSQAPVDYIEVVTPFRRVALEAEARTRAGQRLFGQREALAVLGSDPSRVDIVVELTFHPLNTFVGIPEYRVVLLPLEADPQPLLPSQLARVPRFGPRLTASALPYPYSTGEGVPNASQPLLGGRLVAVYDGVLLAKQQTYWVVVREADRELARARLDFGTLR